METIIVEIKDKEKGRFLKQYLSSLDYLEVKKVRKGKADKPLTKRELELREALIDVELSLAGKKKLKTLDELLNEL